MWIFNLHENNHLNDQTDSSFTYINVNAMKSSCYVQHDHETRHLAVLVLHRNTSCQQIFRFVALIKMSLSKTQTLELQRYLIIEYYELNLIRCKSSEKSPANKNLYFSFDPFVLFSFPIVFYLNRSK